MLDSGKVSYLAEAVDDIDNSRRESSLLDKVAHDQHGQRRLLSKLQNNCVATAKRGPQLPTGHAQGVVPGDNLAANTNGLLQCVRKLGRANINDLTKVLVGIAGIVLEGVDDLLNILVPCDTVRLAVVNSLDSGQGLAVSINEIGKLGHEQPALSAGEALPGRVLESLAGCCHSKVNIFDSGGIDGADLLLGSGQGLVKCAPHTSQVGEYSRRVDGGDLLFIAGLDEFVIYEKAEGLCPGLSIGGSELGLHFSEDRGIVEEGSSWSR